MLFIRDSDAVFLEERERDAVGPPEPSLRDVLAAAAGSFPGRPRVVLLVHVPGLSKQRRVGFDPPHRDLPREFFTLVPAVRV
eukprot:31323-Pelagococcus_subviridis.AAC.14